MKKRGICALCKEEKKFIRAHIISKALFKSIFSEYKKVHYVNVKDLETSNKVQDAFFDNALFCVECDNTFSPFEKYFSDIINGKNIELEIKVKEKRYFPPNYTVDVIEGVDSVKLYLFFLILIWRSSISKQHAFRDVKLNDEMENWIERQIKSGFVDNFEELPVILLSLEDVDDLRKETVIMPIKGMIAQKPVIMFVIKGWIIIYNLERGEIPYNQFRLQNEKQLNIVRLSDEQGILLLNRLTHLTGPFRKSSIEEMKQNPND